MYKAAFYFEWQGRISQPKFHVCKCTAIENFGRDAYRFTNAEPIKVYSRNAHKEVEVEGMELCGYCKRMLMDEEAERVNDSTDFVEILKEAGDVKEPTEYDVDIFGYVKIGSKFHLLTVQRNNLLANDVAHKWRTASTITICKPTTKMELRPTIVRATLNVCVLNVTPKWTIPTAVIFFWGAKSHD